VTEGAAMAARFPIWAMIRGGARLPLRGNLSNLNNLLVDPDLVTVGVPSGAEYDVELTARCPSDERAQRYEGTLRAVLLLVKASGEVRREGRIVQASLKVPAEMVGKLVH